ncbi:cupin domain-containing protein (plasmid) [Microvirga terrae]|uniref:Cupin domain-containing protein n=1 Tax=Microvirga terrae TaxID=2740529 RepID=A0ABY5RY55_9HYPH|nr:cupin domain-containing protein [Microvirga terrae]UVF22211.1 cupin domain-containing protein [Microvirga terrae]
MIDPASLIKTLQLQPHPEGGWYRETWRAEAREGTRGSASAIYFLLEKGQSSHWHRVDAQEMWLWHAGHAISLSTAPADTGPVSSIRLGPGLLDGQMLQYLIQAGDWQAAQADTGWALMTCVVSPAFTFEGFSLAPEGWAPASNNHCQILSTGSL